MSASFPIHGPWAQQQQVESELERFLDDVSVDSIDVQSVEVDNISASTDNTQPYR